MPQNAVRDFVELPAVVIAAFVARNAGVLIVLSALALAAFAGD